MPRSISGVWTSPHNFTAEYLAGQKIARADYVDEVITDIAASLESDSTTTAKAGCLARRDASGNLFGNIATATDLKAGSTLALSKGGTGVSASNSGALLASLGAMRVSQNGADIANAATFRTNLGLGSAATLDAGGISSKQPVKVATTANITLSGAQTIDGISVVAGDRVLVWQQTTTTQNGVYVAASGAWARSEDANGAGDLEVGNQLYVQQGTTYGGYVFIVTAPLGTITPGTSAITFNYLAKLVLDVGALASPSLAFNGHAISGWYSYATNQWGFGVGGTHKALLNTYGLMVGSTLQNPVASNAAGIALRTTGVLYASATNTTTLQVNRSNDGTLAGWWSGGVNQGSISISGTTTSYNTFLGSHWSRFDDGAMPDILPGTVLEYQDKPVVWPGEPGRQYLQMCKVSDTPGSENVYGVFFDYDRDDGHRDLLVASLGAYFIRMQAGQSPRLSDLVESAGDGTARVQARVRVRMEDGSERLVHQILPGTIAKIVGTNPLETFPDGSFLLPIVFCACGG